MAWHKFLLIGLVGTGIAAGCTVTTDDGDDDDGGGTPGDDAGAGGSSGGRGGASAGGTSGGGGVSTGGRGTGGAPAVTCNPSAATNDCQECLESVCCDEFKACAGNDDCTGTSSVDSELECFNDCMIGAATADGGGPTDWQDQTAQCANGCANGGTPADETQDAITCILDGSGATPDGGTPGCSVQCYGIDLSNL